MPTFLCRSVGLPVEKKSKHAFKWNFRLDLKAKVVALINCNPTVFLNVMEVDWSVCLYICLRKNVKMCIKLNFKQDL